MPRWRTPGAPCASRAHKTGSETRWAAPGPRGAIGRGRAPSPSRCLSPVPAGSALRHPDVPIANENRLVVADALGTTIKSTSMAGWRCPLPWRRRATAAATCCDLYTACRRDLPRALPLPNRGLPVIGPVHCGYSQPGTGCLATQCERGSGALSPCSTPNDAPMLCQGIN